MAARWARRSILGSLFTTAAWASTTTPFDEEVRAALAARELSGAHLKVIGAGHGTTGTHSLFKELCGMNFTSWHWEKTCNDVGPKPPFKEREQMGSRMYSEQGAHALRERAIMSILDLAEHRTEVLLDSPAYFMIDDMLAAFPRALVLLSIRDPAAWAARRLDVHGDHELICLETTNASITLGDSAVALPPLPHAFSLRACAERAALRAAAAAAVLPGGTDVEAAAPSASTITFAGLTVRTSRSATLSVLARAFVE